MNSISLFAADRAKAIKTKAVVNESPTEKLIRELREENQRLLDQLKISGGGQPIVMQAEPGQPQMVGISEEGSLILIRISLKALFLLFFALLFYFFHLFIIYLFIFGRGGWSNVQLEPFQVPNTHFLCEFLFLICPLEILD